MEESFNEHMLNQVLAYYGRGAEKERLYYGIGQLEFARSKEIIKRYLPQKPAVIYDIGGGTGVYAFWLAAMGYSVHLMDITPENIQIAEMYANSSGIHLADYQVTDSRKLSQPDQSCDMVLLMGPLYHLPEKLDRINTLKEALRVLRPGGYVLAATISRFANLLYGLSVYGNPSDYLEQEAFQTMVQKELQDGQHIRPEAYPAFLARGYFHLPDEIAAEITEAGFQCEQVLAVEGPAWMVPDFSALWQVPQKRETLMNVTRSVETQPNLFGTSPHLLTVGKKV
ncbi:MAG: SAM-dependent methyltransferase [Anaerolineaceae bacterium]|nr:SAM-dependent methyltransferase [Anaerolineaceae bacterium]